MKKFIKSTILLMLALICILCFVACQPSTTQPKKLNAPTVTLSGNVASWEGDQNAERFEISIDGSLSFVENTVTSKALTNGQAIKVRAIGDGAAYQTSDWSNTVTYTDMSTDTDTDVTPPLDTDTDTNTQPPQDTDTNTDIGSDTGSDTQQPDTPKPDTPNPDTPKPDTPAPTDAPVYLGIIGSKEQPSEDGDVPQSIKPIAKALSLVRNSSQYRTYQEALEEYFANEDNYLGTYPTESSYDIYATPNETVYIQIWLNNPSQYTILSLKLNGVKYQVGGGLSSFFVEDGGVHYNCVYVTVSIPKNDRIDKDYVVTDIEYISNTFINQDGTDEFMNENDTISIGLPYTLNNPTVNNIDTTELKTNGATISFDLADNDNLAGQSGSWLGALVYDDYNILLNKKAEIGNNQITIDGLAENTTYGVFVYLYGDTHDGNGIMVHTINEFYFRTESAIDEFKVEAGYYANADYTEWGGEEADSGLSISVDLFLKSPSATYDRVEIYKGEELVLSDTNFNYYKTYEDFLAQTTYKVVVYYSDNEYTEHYVEEYVTTGKMEAPKMELQEVNSFVKSVAFVFEYPGSGFLRVANYKNLRVRITQSNYEEVEYQDYILDLCDDPTLYDTLKKEYEDAIDRGDWGYANVFYHEKWYFYERANELMKYGDFADFGTDKSKWSEFFSNYSKTFSLGDDDFFANDFSTYLIFKDYFLMFSDDERCNIEVIADVDMKDGNGYVKKTLNEPQEYPKPINHTSNQVNFDINIDGYNITVNPTCRFDGNDYDLAIISYTVNIYDRYYKLVDTLYTSKEIDLRNYDEDAWISAYVAAMKGEAILPSEEAIIEYFDWRAIFEILLNVDFPEEDDFDGNGNGETAEDIVVGGNGNVIVGGGSTGRGNKVIANERERQLLRDLLQYDYNEDYEYRIKSQMINDFMCDEFYYDLIQGLDTEDEILDSLIDGALNSSIIRVLNSCISGIQHYMTWFGSSEDEIYIGFKSLIEEYIEDQNLTPEVNWAESYRRVMMFEDFYHFYPYGEFDIVEIEIDNDKYQVGEYMIGVTYRYDSYEEDYYETRYAGNYLYITGNLPVPTFEVDNYGYLGDFRAETINFWEYHFEVEIKNASGQVIYSGSRENLTEGNNKLSKGYSIRARTVFNEGETSNLYTGNSDWTNWYTYAGMKLEKPSINYSYDEAAARWHTDMNESVAYYVYTINGGSEIKVTTNGEQLTPLKNNDVLRIKAVVSDTGIANDLNDSDWAEFICVDDREQLSAPTNVRIEDGVVLYWDAVDGASCYVIEIVKGIERRTTQVYSTAFYEIKPGETYKVRAFSNNSELKSSVYSESITYSIKLDNPALLKASTSRISWDQVSYAQGYYYKIGVNGEIKTTVNPVIFPAKEGLKDGDEIYVQAYADGCISSDWVLIYTYSSTDK